MALTRKHFKAMAEALKTQVDQLNMGKERCYLTSEQYDTSIACIFTIAQDLAIFCKQENTFFDRQRFMQACGF